MFNVIYLVSGGGPDGQTDILITEAYRAFKVLKRYGLAAAYALIIFAVLYLYGAMTDKITNASKGAFE
jgi:arabinogalactan oligomer/maltooligosaccharide transport system permease protein